NSSTLTSTQPNFSTSRSTALSSHDVPTDYKESHYGKISVRESLASLRARKAMPHLGPPFPRVPAARHDLSANATSEYERVSSSASDTNTSVYDFLPQASASKEAAPDAPHILGPIKKEARFDQLVDAYAETPCVSSKPESQVASLRSPNYPNHRHQDFSAVFVNSFVRTQEPSTQPEITFSHILTEMRAFRHVDSEGT
ncbi:unnamed protein product, partial [Dicrocoelium dendriticum]